MPHERPKPFARSTQPMVLSAIGIRRAIGVCGLILPILLGPVGYFCFDIPIQDNLSSYVHTPLRDVFVGIVFSLGVLLFCYQGHGRLENWTANLASLFAFGLALFPLDPGSDPLHQRSTVGVLHTLCGGGFFLVLAVYCLLHFPTRSILAQRAASEVDGNAELAPTDATPEPHVRQRDLVYRVCGIVILLSMAAMAMYLLLFPADWKRVCNRYHLLFWLEWVAVWSFAAAWLTKGRAILTDLAIDIIALTQDKIWKPRH